MFFPGDTAQGAGDGQLVAGRVLRGAIKRNRLNVGQPGFRLCTDCACVTHKPLAITMSGLKRPMRLTASGGIDEMSLGLVGPRAFTSSGSQSSIRIVCRHDGRP